MTAYVTLTANPSPDRLQRVMDLAIPDVTQRHVDAMRDDCLILLRRLGVPDPTARRAQRWAPTWDVQRIVDAASQLCGRSVRCVQQPWAASLAGAIVSSPDCHVLFAPPGSDARATHVLLHGLAHVLFGDPVAAHLPTAEARTQATADTTADTTAAEAEAEADRETRADLFATMAAGRLAGHQAGWRRVYSPEVHVGAPADRLFGLLVTWRHGAGRNTPPRSTGDAHRAAQ